MDPRSIATGYEIRDLRVVISSTGNVAWFSAVVDDEGTFDGNYGELKISDGQVYWRYVAENGL